MARSKTTGKKVATSAAKALKNPKASKQLKAVAGSALAQVAPKRKAKKAPAKGKAKKAA